MYNPYSSAVLVQRPHRVEESRAAAARGEGRHVDDAGGDEELPEGVDARGVEIFFARYFLDLGAFGPHLARVLGTAPAPAFASVLLAASIE